LITPLDKIPFPARDLYDNTKWNTIITSRDVLINAYLCIINFLEFSSVSLPQYVVNEIKELVLKYKVNTILIVDDNFIADRRRVKKYPSKFKKKTLIIR